MDRNKRRSIFSGLLVGLLFGLCGVLGALQYLWNSEVNAALRDRLQASLQASLDRLSGDFNREISTTCSGLLPPMPRDLKAAETDVAARFERWRAGTRRRGMIRGIGLAQPEADRLKLQLLDADKAAFHPAPWPAGWKPLEARLDAILRGPLPGTMDHGFGDEGTAFEAPIFATGEGASRDVQGFRRREVGWLIFDINPEYLRDTLLPEALQQHLSSGGSLDYQVEVVNRYNPSEILYRSDPNEGDIANTADGSVNLFEVSWPRGPGFGPRVPKSPPRGRGADSNPGGGADAGRWEMFVRHRAGSLAAVVAQTRRRNLAVTAGVLLLMLATVTAWVQFTRRAQRLAELQMDFVAGISHELRTPLTVIHTAAYNLQGKLANQPAQVERYGKLIQQESGRLKDIVEQVLQFSSAKAGRVLQQREPVEIEDVIDQMLESSRTIVEAAHCVVEKKVAAGLPPVEGDARALRLALENLVSNAAKYGSGGGGWIGISATADGAGGGPAVEIRVADRGPGIPPEEQKHVFDPFFRGRRAVEDQVHGTGLGLNLVKKIVEAHGGSVALRSAPGAGTEFIVRIPAIEGFDKGPGNAA